MKKVIMLEGAALAMLAAMNDRKAQAADKLKELKAKSDEIMAEAQKVAEEANAAGLEDMKTLMKLHNVESEGNHVEINDDAIEHGVAFMKVEPCECGKGLLDLIGKGGAQSLGDALGRALARGETSGAVEIPVGGDASKLH